MTSNSSNKIGHVAIIMDGNSRWARQRNLKTIEGHKPGVNRLRDIVKYSAKSEITHLSVFAFSTENWLREEGEVRDLISLFFDALEEQTPDLREEKVKLNFIGDISRFNKKLIKQIIRPTGHYYWSQQFKLAITESLNSLSKSKSTKLNELYLVGDYYTDYTFDKSLLSDDHDFLYALSKVPTNIIHYIELN